MATSYRLDEMERKLMSLYVPEPTLPKSEDLEKIDYVLFPLHDNVLVFSLLEEDFSIAEGIFIPNKVVAKNPFNTSLTAVVMAVGPGKKTSEGIYKSTGVSPGETVVLNGSKRHGVYSTKEYRLDIVSAQDIWAVID